MTTEHDSPNGPREVKQNSAIITTAYRLIKAGIDVIPVLAGRKQPLFEDWPSIDSRSQIERALSEEASFNIGIRGGGAAGLIVIDCEDLNTRLLVAGWLDYCDVVNYVTVRSASGSGFHIWLRCNNRPPEYDSFSPLLPIFGIGEVRYGPGSQTLAPPSIAYSKRGQCERAYIFEAPYSIDAFETMEAIDWDSVIAPLFDPNHPHWEYQVQPENQPTSISSTSLNLIERLPYQPAPALVYDLISILQTAAPGCAIAHPRGTREPYASRSEAEEAIITILILCGWSYDQIADLFEMYQPGHYREHPCQDSYLARSYRNAVREIVETPERQEIARLCSAFLDAPWPFGSYLSQAVYGAVLLIAWREAEWEPVVTQAELQAITGGSSGGVCEALARLESKEYSNLITKIREKNVSYLRIRIRPDAQFLSYSHSGGVESGITTRIMKVLESVGNSYTLAPVYRVLSHRPHTIQEIVELTGISRNTVSDRLQDLASNGLAVQVSRYGWVRASAMEGTGEVEKSGEAASSRQQSQDQRILVEDVGNGDARRVREARIMYPEHDCGCGVVEPVKAYTDVMNLVFQTKLHPDNIDVEKRQLLDDLVVTLNMLYVEGRVPTGCVRCYIHWVSTHLKKWAKEKEWPVIWIDALVADAILEWYQSEYRRQLHADRRPWPVPRGVPKLGNEHPTGSVLRTSTFSR